MGKYFESLGQLVPNSSLFLSYQLLSNQLLIMYSFLRGCTDTIKNGAHQLLNINRLFYIVILLKSYSPHIIHILFISIYIHIFVEYAHKTFPRNYHHLNSQICATFMQLTVVGSSWK